MDRLDIIVLGATGFTGAHVVKKLALCSKEEYSDLKWGIAGRSRDKLKDLLMDLERTGTIDSSKIPIFECDIKNVQSLTKTAERAKVLMNVTGPCTVLSDPVVRTCIQTRTHYVDISAELYHMLKIYREYHEAAEAANVLVITACGFGSIPCVMGLMHLQKNFQGTLHSVECYTELEIPRRAYLPGPNKCLVHYGTWASLVHELQNHKEYTRMKKETFPVSINEPLPRELKKCFFHRQNGKLWFPYPGPDHDVIEMTQRYLHDKKRKKPLHFKIYTTMPLLFHFFIVVPAFFIAYILCYFKCFRNLLWKYPKFFSLGYMSHKGPTEEMANDTKFNFVLTGKGWGKERSEMPPNEKLTLKVSGYDPGYKTTAEAFVFSAITILKDYSVMPKGGVVTTGAAFAETELVERMNNRIMNFEFINNDVIANV